MYCAQRNAANKFPGNGIEKQTKSGLFISSLFANNWINLDSIMVN